MAGMIPDVTFPLFRRGESAVVRDLLPMRLLSLSGTTIDGRWHGDGWSSPEWRFYLNLDAGAEVIVNRRRIPLRPGELYAIPAWLRWSARCQGQVRHFNALVELPTLPRERVLATCTGVLHLAGATEPLARDWLELAARLASVKHAGPMDVAHGHAVIYAALARVFDRLGANAAGLLPTSGATGLEPILTWVDRYLHQPVSRAALARVAGCSEAELARRFQRHLGTSPARWVRQRRVTTAAELLRVTDEPIEAIAVRCGLGERSHFSRTFAQLCGCGPAAYRRRCVVSAAARAPGPAPWS